MKKFAAYSLGLWSKAANAKLNLFEEEKMLTNDNIPGAAAKAVRQVDTV